jgi:DNA-binding response OmpR family regulator
MAHKILVVEDEVKIARFLELELTHEGYEVETVHDGLSGCQKGLSNEFDLIILDLMLPIISGIEVCRRIRKESEVPIIMLTAKDDVSDKVMGLDTGANDYITKPFAIEELFARIRSIKRTVHKNKIESPKVLTAGKLTLNIDQYKVTYDNIEIAMTKKEFLLLQYLMQNSGIVLKRELILEKVWGFDFTEDTKIIDVYIRYLRAKIDDSYKVKFIHTVRGVGYQFKYK